MKYHVSVDMVIDVPPDRLEEWIHASFDTAEERVEVSELPPRARVVKEVGPEVEDLVLEAASPNDTFEEGPE